MRFFLKATLNFILLFLFSVMNISNVHGSDVEMADLMRSNGMIYVVIAVLAIIFVGILVFLLIIERRLKKLENKEE